MNSVENDDDDDEDDIGDNDDGMQARWNIHHSIDDDGRFNVVFSKVRLTCRK